MVIFLFSIFCGTQQVSLCSLIKSTPFILTLELGQLVTVSESNDHKKSKHISRSKKLNLMLTVLSVCSGAATAVFDATCKFNCHCLLYAGTVAQATKT